MSKLNSMQGYKKADELSKEGNLAFFYKRQFFGPTDEGWIFTKDGRFLGDAKSLASHLVALNKNVLTCEHYKSAAKQFEGGVEYLKKLLQKAKLPLTLEDINMRLVKLHNHNEIWGK